MIEFNQATPVHRIPGTQYNFNEIKEVLASIAPNHQYYNKKQVLVSAIRGVYILTNTMNGYVYVGRSKDLAKRLGNNHKVADTGQLIHQKITEYGRDAFVIELVLITNDMLAVIAKENELRRDLNSEVVGYNGQPAKAQETRDDYFKPVTFEGIEYPSLSTASNKLKIPLTTLYNYIKLREVIEARSLQRRAELKDESVIKFKSGDQNQKGQ